ncbi:MAG: DUF996 domain-containing protein [Archaeoglobaceae archaeon]
MGTLQSPKNLGGIGSVLVLIGAFIPYVGGAVAIAGLIFVLLAVKGLSDELKDPVIFRNYLIAFLLSIVAVILSAAIFVIFFLSTIFGSKTGSLGGWQVLIRLILAPLITIWIFSIVSAIFLRKSFTSIAEKTGIKMFRTTGTFYLLGALLIILLVGFILFLIAAILQILAFFSLPEQSQIQKFQDPSD